MFGRLLACLALTVCSTPAGTAAAIAAEPRTALIIGNARYSYAPLANPTNDAGDMATVLRQAGFDVMLRTDADRHTMRDAVRAFGSALRSKGGVGLFYFAGHGVQIGGENYIVPVGEPIASGDQLKQQAVTASEVVDAMAATRNGLNIVVLDACRDNPIAAASGVRGLSRIDSGASLFVSFSTSPGAVALDGSGRNSPYTKHLAQAIGTTNLTLEDTFKRTLKGVYQETRGEQTPWLSSSFFGDFVFRPGGTGGVGPAAIPKPSLRQGPIGPAQTAASLITGVYRSEGTNPNGSRYRGMAAVASDGNRLRFTWWIGSQTYSGTGQFAGRMLVVNWGAKHPVIYDFGPRGMLDGEWADGTATDRLELFARAGQRAVPPLGGRYRVSGRNPNGSRYSGTAVIAQRGDRVEISWSVGRSAYNGIGVLDSKLLTVEWGGGQPIVYAVTEDGTLRGLWSGGQGEDILIPDR
jgi:hypothetical protein